MRLICVGKGNVQENNWSRAYCPVNLQEYVVLCENAIPRLKLDIYLPSVE